MRKYKVKTQSDFYAEIDILGSKSITNRVLILAVFSDDEVILKNPLFSDDTIYMIEALRSLGNKIEISDDKKYIKVLGNKTREFGNKKLFVGNAGTAMRFLSSYIATGIGEIILEGNERMNQRPIGELVDSLRELGVKIEYLKEIGYPPIKIFANGINKNVVNISGKNSSQYLSSILMGSPYFNNGLEIKINDKIISRPYVDMTLKMMEQFGVKVVALEKGYKIEKSKYKLSSEYIIEGDMSSASYFLAAAFITNSRIKINNFVTNSIQGDLKILNILKGMGLKVIEEQKESITVEGVEKYQGFNLKLNETPDIVPTLAVVALFANSPSSIREVESLRVKECDRISAICNEIKKLDGTIIEYSDGFEIFPKKLSEYRGAEIETYDDHRIAMSFSIAGLKIEDIEILNPNCVSKTFPTFFEELDKIYLGGENKVEDKKKAE